LAAAVGAVQSGASVIVLEKGPTAGGTTIKSDGAYWIPDNHHMQAKGIADPKEDALRYMPSSSYPLNYRGDKPRFGLAENSTR
jgi:3-oxosteroid 1-dehydrogenase